MDVVYPVRPGDSNFGSIFDMATCIVVGCENPRHVAAGHCSKHHYRVKKYGTPEPALERQQRRGMICVLPDCMEARYSGKYGWCKRHYDRWRRHGDPHTVLLPMGRGDNVTVSAVHKRLDAKRGRASQHPCVDCGQPARHWSYGHTDPNEKQSDHGPYSPDIAHYQPRCVPCHKRFDLQRCGGWTQSSTRRWG